MGYNNGNFKMLTSLTYSMTPLILCFWRCVYTDTESVYMTFLKENVLVMKHSVP